MSSSQGEQSDLLELVRTTKWLEAELDRLLRHLCMN